MKDIEKVPKKIEHTKIFHKICSYLHMILEQEHKEKWASRQDKIERENRREHSRRLIRLSALMKPTDNKAYDKLLSTSGSFSRYNSDMKVKFS
jgi:adenylate kinase